MTAKLSWDAFFKDASEAQRDAVSYWRKVEWPNVLRDLRQRHDLDIASDSEPHWVGPGSAVLWQRRETLQADVEANEQGQKEIRGFSSVVGDWEPTAPLSVGNAERLAYYLTRKGLRLRPPRDDAGDAGRRKADAAVESALSQEDRRFRCERHKIAFAVWGGYVAHCKYRHEPLDVSQRPEGMEPPDRAFYCAEHDFATDFERQMRDHIRLHLRRPQPGSHVSLEATRRRTREKQDTVKETKKEKAK